MTWEVFYSPHSDDESIGMAGSIARALDHGHSVLVVLVTDNEPSSRGRRLFANRPDLEACRLAEWTQALAALGVVHTETWDIPERQIRHDPFAAQTEMLQRIHAIHDRLRPIHHHTVWGTIDVHEESGISSLSHVLCSNALAIFAAECPRVSVSMYGVYVYSRPKEERIAPVIRALSDTEMLRKQKALQCYSVSESCIGYGYASVPELITAACDDPREFVIEVSYSHAPFPGGVA